MSPRTTIPFSVVRNHRGPLVEQTTYGLRKAIVSGFYKAGDVLPSTQRLAEALGVSRIVTRAAMAALTAEGLVNPRPGVGSVVLAHGERLWKGNVLFVSRTNGTIYYENVFHAHLRQRLVAAGWHLTDVTTYSPSGVVDTAELELQLVSRVDFALVLFDNPAAERLLAKAHVPYVVLGDRKAYRSRGAVGYVRFDRSAGAAALVAACRTLGVRRVLQVGVEDFGDLDEALAAAGMASEKWHIKASQPDVLPETSFHNVRDAFLKLLAEGTRDWADLVYFSDDCGFVGAFAALAKFGVRIPDDLRLATFAVKGNCPVSYGELPRLELDPVSDAALLAEAILSYLAHARWRAPATIRTHFIGGEGLVSSHLKGESFKYNTKKRGGKWQQGS